MLFSTANSNIQGGSKNRTIIDILNAIIHFGRYHRNTISAIVDTMSTLLLELVSLREGHLFFDGGCQLTTCELRCIIIDCVVCMLLCMLATVLFFSERERSRSLCVVVLSHHLARYTPPAARIPHSQGRAGGWLRSAPVASPSIPE